MWAGRLELCAHPLQSREQNAGKKLSAFPRANPHCSLLAAAKCGQHNAGLLFGEAGENRLCDEDTRHTRREGRLQARPDRASFQETRCGPEDRPTTAQSLQWAEGTPPQWDGWFVHAPPEFPERLAIHLEGAPGFPRWEPASSKALGVEAMPGRAREQARRAEMRSGTHGTRDGLMRAKGA